MRNIWMVFGKVWVSKVHARLAWIRQRGCVLVLVLDGQLLPNKV